MSTCIFVLCELCHAAHKFTDLLNKINLINFLVPELICDIRWFIVVSGMALPIIVLYFRGKNIPSLLF